MTETQVSNNAGNQKAVAIEIPKDPGLAQSALNGVGDSFSTGAKLIAGAARLGMDCSTYIFNKVVRPYALPVTGVGATATAGYVGLQTFGVSGLATAGLLTAGAAATAVGGVFALGLSIKAGKGMLGAYEFTKESLCELGKDIGARIDAFRVAKKTFFNEVSTNAVHKCEKKSETEAGKAATETLTKLAKLEQKYADQPEVLDVISQVKEAAKQAFEIATTKYPEQVALAVAENIKPAEAAKQVAAHAVSLRDMLTTDVFRAFSESSDQQATLSAKLLEINTFASEFKITASKKIINFDVSEA